MGISKGIAGIGRGTGKCRGIGIGVHRVIGIPVWGGGGPLKPPQNIRKTNATKTTRTGGPAAPREPTKSHKSFENQRKAY